MQHNSEEIEIVASVCGRLKQYLSGCYSTLGICSAVCSVELDQE